MITYSSGHHDSALGLALFALDDTGRARTHLTRALDTMDKSRTRTGLRCRIRLAVLDLQHGATDDATSASHRIVEDVVGVTSTRIRADLRMLRDAAATYGASALAADLQHVLGDATYAAQELRR